MVMDINFLFNWFKSIFSLKWRLTLFGVYFPLLIFILLGLAVFNYPSWLWWDIPILVLIHKITPPFFYPFAVSITDFGYYSYTVPIVLLISLILAIRKKWRSRSAAVRSLLYVFLTMLGSLSLNYTMKTIFHRPRPFLWEDFYPLLPTYSFPSGHTLSSMTLVIILIVLTGQTRWRYLIIILGTIFALLIAWSRLYLGVHYPSDILGAWSLAIYWGVGVSLLLK